MSNKQQFSSAAEILSQLVEMYEIKHEETHLSRSTFGELKGGAV